MKRSPRIATRWHNSLHALTYRDTLSARRRGRGLLVVCTYSSTVRRGAWVRVNTCRQSIPSLADHCHPHTHPRHLDQTPGRRSLRLGASRMEMVAHTRGVCTKVCVVGFHHLGLAFDSTTRVCYLAKVKLRSPPNVGALRPGRWPFRCMRLEHRYSAYEASDCIVPAQAG